MSAPRDRSATAVGAAGACLLLVAALACSGDGVTTDPSGGGGGLITGASASSTSSSGGGAATSSSSTSGSSSGGGGSGAMGGGGSAAGTGGSGAQGGDGPTCTDIGIGEPNESENTAFALTNVNDCASALTVSGTIAGNEEDWFVYEGDDAFCIVNPERSFTQPGGLQLCKFFECSNGQSNTSVNCPSGTSPAISPGGRPGCCAGGGFKLSDFNGLNCTGSIDDDAFVFIRIRADPPDASTCADYSYDYNY